MSKHNKKYNQIVSTAKDLFWKYGIKRVAIEEICKEAEVSKMTFYKFFDNKNDLATTIIDQVYDEGLEDYRKIMASDKSFKNKLLDLTHLKLNAVNHISHEFLHDWIKLIDKDSKLMQEKVNSYLDIIMKELTEAQKNGEIRADIKPEFISYFLNHLLTLTNDPQLNTLYPEAEDMIMELMNFFFYGVMPNDNIQD